MRKKYRFDNNFCFYCDKPKHRIINHKITIQRVNFVISIPIKILSTTAPFAIEIPFAIAQQQKKILNFASNRLQKPSRSLIFVLILILKNSVVISNNKYFVSRCTIKFNELFNDPNILFDIGANGEILMVKK